MVIVRETLMPTDRKLQRNGILKKGTGNESKLCQRRSLGCLAKHKENHAKDLHNDQNYLCIKS